MTLPKTRSARAAVVMLLAASAGSPALAHRLKLKDLEIVHPSTVETANAAETAMVVTMTIHNRGKTPDRLVGASSELAASVELTSGGTSSGTAIDLPADGTVAFTKAGPHIVLHGMKKPMSGYATFPLKLTFEKAGSVEAVVLVEENDAAAGGSQKN